MKSGFLISALFILEGENCSLKTLGSLAKSVDKAWSKGDRIGATLLTRKANGAQFCLLRDCADTDWLTNLEPPLTEFCSNLADLISNGLEVVPRLHFPIFTDGVRLPPLFLPSRVLRQLSLVGAAVDFDPVMITDDHPYSHDCV